jgi:hypothetical protein
MRSQTHFRRYRGRRVPFSCFAYQTYLQRYWGRQVPFYCFALPNSFSTVPRSSGLVLRFRTRFRRYRGRRVPFSHFAVPRAYGPVFMFCAPGHVFGGTEGVWSCLMSCTPGLVFGGTVGVGSRFHVLRARNRFRRGRGHWVPFSCYTPPDSFSAVPGASGPFLIFCAPGLVFGCTEGVRFSCFAPRTRFRQYRRCRAPFSCFVLPDSFSAVPRASSPVFFFCAPGLVFGINEGVRSRFHVLLSRTRFSAILRALGPVLTFCASVFVFGGIDGVGSRFLILRSRTRFQLYRGRRVPFSCFALPETFSTVPGASGVVFMFCAPVLIFGGTEGVGYRFHILRSRTRFRR